MEQYIICSRAVIKFVYLLIQHSQLLPRTVTVAKNRYSAPGIYSVVEFARMALAYVPKDIITCTGSVMHIQVHPAPNNIV